MKTHIAGLVARLTVGCLLLAVAASASAQTTPAQAAPAQTDAEDADLLRKRAEADQKKP